MKWKLYPMCLKSSKLAKFFNVLLSTKDEEKNLSTAVWRLLMDTLFLHGSVPTLHQSSSIVFKFEWGPGAFITFCRALSITKLWLNVTSSCLIQDQHLFMPVSTTDASQCLLQPICSLNIEHTRKEMAERKSFVQGDTSHSANEHPSYAVSSRGHCQSHSS